MTGASKLQAIGRALMAVVIGAVLLGAALPCAAMAGMPMAQPMAVAVHQHQAPERAVVECVIACPLSQAILSPSAAPSPLLSASRVEFEEAAVFWRSRISRPRAPPPR